jgi:hypothetical protein
MPTRVPAQGTRDSTSRHRSRGVAPVSGAPRHGATGPPAARAPEAPDRPGRSTSGRRLEARLRHPRDAIFKPRGPGRHRRTPRTRDTRAGARATARSAEVMRDTAGAVSRAPKSVGIAMPTRVPEGTRGSTSRHRSRGVAHVSGAPRHGATGPPAARAPEAPDRPGRSTSGRRLEARLRHPRDAIFKPRGPGRHRRTPRTRDTRAGARATRRGAPRSCVTPRERCHERQCRSASPCRPGCPQGTRSGGLR